MNPMNWTLVAYVIAGCLVGGYALSILCGYYLCRAPGKGADAS